LKLQTLAAFSAALGFAFFVLSVTTTFTSPRLLFSFSPASLVAVNLASGSVALLLGYVSVVVVGGGASVSLASFLSRATRSKQVVEVSRGPPRSSLLGSLYLAIPPAVCFVVATALAFDFFALDRSGVVSLPVIRYLDIFARDIRTSPISRSLEVLPVLLLLATLAGLIPSTVLPYFGRLRITAVNSSPFHTGFLATMVGVVAGASVLFTLLGFFYKVLFSTGEPIYYHYSVLTLAGLALFYATGSYLGLERSERRLLQSIMSKGSDDGIFVGRVAVSRSEEPEV